MEGSPDAYFQAQNESKLFVGKKKKNIKNKEVKFQKAENKWGMKGKVREMVWKIWN